jgi:hypothetical protein
LRTAASRLASLLAMFAYELGCASTAQVLARHAPLLAA